MLTLATKYDDRETMALSKMKFEQSEFYDDLVKSISEPEPMCVVLVNFSISEIEPLVDFTKDIEAVVPSIISNAVHERMAKDLRPYDLLSVLASNSFVGALKTLVNEAELGDRLVRMKDLLSKPYKFKELEAQVAIEIGYAVRKPGETPAQLLRRADETRTLASPS